jgi:nickel/cobalt transporter (NicO) family protein
MISTTPALLGAAAGVGFGHAVLPDHWVPLAVISRTQRYSLGRVARLSGLAGLAHVLVSLVLGGVIIAVGLQFRSAVQSAESVIIGSLLVATGLGFVILELAGHGHGHEHGPGKSHGQEHAPGESHEHDREHRQAGGEEHAAEAHRGRLRGLTAVMVPFGAAASPDLTILPVFLAATAAGTAVSVGCLVVFSAVTVTTIVGLTLAATFGGYQLRGQWLERWGNLFTAIVLVIIGALVLSGSI